MNRNGTRAQKERLEQRSRERPLQVRAMWVRFCHQGHDLGRRRGPRPGKMRSTPNPVASAMPPPMVYAGTHATATEGQQLRPTKRQCTSVPGHEPLPSAPAQPAPLQVLQPRPTHIAHAPEGGADDAADADLHARWRTAGLGPGQLRALDGEGRVVITDHGALVLVNVYGPYVGVKRTEERMRYKIAFYRVRAEDRMCWSGQRAGVLRAVARWSSRMGGNTPFACNDLRPPPPSLPTPPTSAGAAAPPRRLPGGRPAAGGAGRLQHRSGAA